MGTGGQRLAEAQSVIARLVRAPEGVCAALMEAGDPEGRSLAVLVRGDAQLSASLRLEVYANAYFHRIREALEVEYETLAEAIGPAAMNDLIAAYLIVYPSHNPSLRWAGARLPEFLDSHAAAEPFRCRWPWAADLASLEWARSLAFDAADAPVLERRDLSTLTPASWSELVLAFQPAMQLVRLAWPVHGLCEARAGRPLASPPTAPQPTALCVWRREEVVLQRALDPLEAELLDRAQRGGSFGALCEHAAQALGDDAAPAHAGTLLARWLDEGLLAPTSS
jgi:hypothetical protein